MKKLTTSLEARSAHSIAEPLLPALLLNGHAFSAGNKDGNPLVGAWRVPKFLYDGVKIQAVWQFGLDVLLIVSFQGALLFGRNPWPDLAQRHRITMPFTIPSAVTTRRIRNKGWPSSPCKALCFVCLQRT